MPTMRRSCSSAQPLPTGRASCRPSRGRRRLGTRWRAIGTNWQHPARQTTASLLLGGCPDMFFLGGGRPRHASNSLVVARRRARDNAESISARDTSQFGFPTKQLLAASPLRGPSNISMVLPRCFPVSRRLTSNRDCPDNLIKIQSLIWWSQAESNRRPLECHSSALPTELWPHLRTRCQEPASSGTRMLAPAGSRHQSHLKSYIGGHLKSLPRSRCRRR